MNCFTYTLPKKMIRGLGKTGTFTIPVYQTQILPAEGDRIYFNNSEDVYTVEKVTPKDGTIDDELARPYFVGFFELTLRRLFNRFETVSVLSLYESGEFHESGYVANDAAGLYAQFEADLALAEARSEGKLKVSAQEEQLIIAEAMRKAVGEFWSNINPSVFCYEGCCEMSSNRLFRVKYDPVVAYLDDYEPVALMLFYREHDLDSNEVMESIPVSYINTKVAESYDLTTEDLQYIVEELFFETLIDFDPETAVAVLENPTITIPESQVVFYEGLIDGNGWTAGQENGFGYRVFN